MFTDPVSQFFEGVVPAYEQYIKLSKKKDNNKFILMGAAILAADMLFHYREALIPLYPPKALTRAEVSKFYDYDLIGDVFNATKHDTLTQKRGEILISNRKAIEETIVCTYFPFEGETTYPREFYGVKQTRILVYPTRGGVRDLLEIATNVINYWADFLVKEGLTDKHINFRYEGDDILSHRQALEIGNSSSPVHARIGGDVGWVMIARYYEPQTKTFNRWGFTKKGELGSFQIKENAPNAKLYGYFKPTLGTIHEPGSSTDFVMQKGNQVYLKHINVT